MSISQAVEFKCLCANSKFRAGFLVYRKYISTLDEWRRLLYVGNSVHRKSAVARCLEAGRNG